MNAFFTLRHATQASRRGLVLAALLAVSAIPASAAILGGDSGHYCLQQWPNDHDSYLLCQQLQNRNQMQFRQFLSDHDLNENMLAAGHVPATPAAKTARYCRDRWAPDYQSIWSCIKRRTHDGN